MKKISCLLLITSSIFLACKKDYQGDTYDFSNRLPTYVSLSSTTAKTVRQGTSTTFTFQMRTALQQTVTVYYDVTGGGVNLTNQTVIIGREKLSAIATVNIPMVIVSPATSATATLTFVKAVAADGTLLTIGSKNTAATQKVTINITL